jgi:hypothetical protein
VGGFSGQGETLVGIGIKGYAIGQQVLYGLVALG